MQEEPHHFWSSRRWTLGLAGLSAVLVLSACGGSAEDEGEEAYRSIRQGQTVDYSELSCGALEYLAGKYSSIADSGMRMNGESPAATAVQMQAMQAANKASQLYGMVAAGDCK